MYWLKVFFFFLFFSSIYPFNAKNSAEFQDVPYVFPESENGRFGIAFLWWKPYAFIPHSMTYEQSTITPLGIVERKNEEIEEVHLSFHPGIKVEFDFRLPIDTWHIQTDYTRLVSKDDRYFAKNDGVSSFEAIWMSNLGFNDAFTSGEVFVEQNLNFNTLDVSLLRNFYGQHFIFMPFIGLKGALIKNHLYPSYVTNVNADIQVDSSVRLTNQFRGVGLRGGFISDFTVNKLWKFFAKTAVSGLVSRTTFRAKNSYTLTESGSTFSGVIQTNAIRELGVQSVIELGFGTSVTYHAKCSDRYASLITAYELQIWPDHLLFQRLLGGSTSPIQYYKSNLSMQGLTAKLALAF